MKQNWEMRVSHRGSSICKYSEAREAKEGSKNFSFNSNMGSRKAGRGQIMKGLA